MSQPKKPKKAFTRIVPPPENWNVQARQWADGLHLPLAEGAIMNFLARRSNMDDEAIHSLAYIAFDIGTGRTNVSECMKSLKAKGLISWVKAHERNNRYTLHVDYSKVQFPIGFTRIRRLWFKALNLPRPTHKDLKIAYAQYLIVLQGNEINQATLLKSADWFLAEYASTNRRMPAFRNFFAYGSWREYITRGKPQKRVVRPPTKNDVQGEAVHKQGQSPNALVG